MLGSQLDAPMTVTRTTRKSQPRLHLMLPAGANRSTATTSSAATDRVTAGARDLLAERNAGPHAATANHQTIGHDHHAIADADGRMENQNGVGRPHVACGVGRIRRLRNSPPVAPRHRPHDSRSVSSHCEVSHAESHQSERKDQFISHSQRRRELVDKDDDAQDHRPPQTGHPDEDHGHHERRAAS
jgi:hypothetical protein